MSGNESGAAALEFSSGDRVKLHGLSSDSSLNGLVVTVKAWDASIDRYSLQSSTLPNLLLVRSQNMSRELTAGAAPTATDGASVVTPPTTRPTSASIPPRVVDPSPSPSPSPSPTPTTDSTDGTAEAVPSTPAKSKSVPVPVTVTPSASTSTAGSAASTPAASSAGAAPKSPPISSPNRRKPPPNQTEEERRRHHYAQLQEDIKQKGPKRILCDNLKKKSRQTFGGKHQWQRRLWILDEEKLTCFKKDNPSNPGVELPLWTILSIIRFPDKANGCRFDIKTGDQIGFSLLCPSKDTCDNWVYHLMEAVQSAVKEKFWLYL